MKKYEICTALVKENGEVKQFGRTYGYGCNNPDQFKVEIQRHSVKPKKVAA